MKTTLRTIASVACIAALTACSSSDDDSARVSGLEADLAKANEALSQLEAEVVAGDQYTGLRTGYVSSSENEEERAPDGSTLTIEFSGSEQSRPDLVLDRMAASPPPLGDWQGEIFESARTVPGDTEEQTVAVLYRTKLGTETYLQFGYWQTELTNSAGRSWLPRYSQLVSARGNFEQISDITELQGQATFEGHAAGIYAISNPSDGQNDSGQFTADATLAVDFGDGSASGTITNFVAAGEQKGWNVDLLSQEFDPNRRSFRIPPENRVADTRWTISAEQDMPGDSGANWWFVAPLKDRGDQSMGAIGGFQAIYTNIGRMSGAFATKKTQ